MALDFHRLDTHEFLFALNDEQYNHLSERFENFRQRTGIEINPYASQQLTVDNCQTLIQIVDKYVRQNDLNRDKLKTKALIGFQGLLKFFAGKGINFKLQGD